MGKRGWPAPVRPIVVVLAIVGGGALLLGELGKESAKRGKFFGADRRATIALGETRTGTGSSLEVHAGPAGVWINLADRLVRVDPRTNEVTHRFDGPGFAGDIALGAGSLWVADEGILTRRDPRTGALVAEIPLGLGRRAEGSYGQGVVFGEGAIWVATGGSGGAAIARIDPGTNRVVATIEGGSFHSLAAGQGGVWLLGREGLARIDPRTDRLGPMRPLPGVLRTVAAGEGHVWVARGEPRLGEESRLIRIDPKTLSVTAEIEFEYSGAVVVGEGAVWVLDLQYPA